MTVQRITFSNTYVQDEHQRVQTTLANAADSVATNYNYTEIRLGHVYVTSTTAGQTQQAIEPIILVSGSGVQARYYWASIPFNGNVMAFLIDCPATLSAACSVALIRVRNNVTSTAATLPVPASAARASVNLTQKPIAIAANDIFYAVVTFPTAVSSTYFCGFLKMYIQTSK